MPFPTKRIRVGSRALAVVALSVGMFALPAGCETLQPNPPAEPVVRSAEPNPPATSAPPTLPSKHHTRSGCCVFYHDFPLDRNDPLLREPEVLPDQVYGELRLPPGNTLVQVYLFDTQERYERYMFDPKVGRFKDQPARRAYFFTVPRVGGEDLQIFTWMGHDIQTDLRHELTHALLNGVLKSVPLWLDEGLAGYFELPSGNDGVNPQHLETLRRGPSQPDLRSLEKLVKVEQMQKPQYRESWAWVHFMLNGNPDARKVLLDYLHSLRTNANAGPLLPKLREVIPDPNAALVDHLANIEFPPRSRAK